MAGFLGLRVEIGPPLFQISPPLFHIPNTSQGNGFASIRVEISPALIHISPALFHIPNTRHRNGFAIIMVEISPALTRRTQYNAYGPKDRTAEKGPMELAVFVGYSDCIDTTTTKRRHNGRESPPTPRKTNKKETHQ